MVLARYGSGTILSELNSLRAILTVLLNLKLSSRRKYTAMLSIIKIESPKTNTWVSEKLWFSKRDGFYYFIKFYNLRISEKMDLPVRRSSFKKNHF